MNILKRLWHYLRSIRPVTWLIAGAGAIALLLLFIGGLYAWDYTNTSYFCGTTCHTMPPHYESYLRSPHARVACVECHIGRTFIGVQFTRKAVDAQFVWAYVTGQYEYPIYAKSLQPARESCEKCHWPEKFSWDEVVKKTDYQFDEANTPIDTTLVIKTGGGSARVGLGRGIHWHIENPIEFYYTDKLGQNIPYIEVTHPDGTKTAYADIENPLTPAQLAQLPKRQMDCIDCHNRVSHTFLTPAEAMDNLLATKQIDPTIPNIKQKGTEVLASQYGGSLELAAQAIARVEQYYKQNFAEYYQQHTAAVQNAVAKLQEWYPKLHFPDQGLNWSTHPDNLGHKDWPGCFRCHDGKHFTLDRKEAIRLECNICHSIPVVYKAGQSAPAISLERVEEPASHKTTTWLIEHRSRFDATCQQCHDTRNAGGRDNSSFCSNSACHGTEWTFAGFDAPALAQILKPPIKPPRDPNAPPSQIPHPIGGNPDCQICHGLNSRVRPMPNDHEGRTNDLCLACHQPTIPPQEQPAEAGKPPSIPHELAGRAECLGCHAGGAAAIPQIPSWHLEGNFTNGQCTNCHQPSKRGELIPTRIDVSPTPSPTATHTPIVEPTPTATEARIQPPTPTEIATTEPTVTATSEAEVTEIPTATMTPSATTSAIPHIPANHFTAGCTACHASGISDAPIFPEDHATFTNAQCATCHKPE